MNSRIARPSNLNGSRRHNVWNMVYARVIDTLHCTAQCGIKRMSEVSRVVIIRERPDRTNVDIICVCYLCTKTNASRL